MDYMQVYG